MAVSPDAHATTADAAGPDRSIPEQIVQLALLAIRHGAQDVSVHHSGLGFEFKAPIGWMVRIRRDQRTKGRSVDDLYAEHQIGCDLDDFVAPGWLAEAAANGAIESSVIDDYVDLFETGLRGGWEMTYTRQVRMHEIYLQVISQGENGPHEDTLGLQHELRGRAFWHRSRKAKSVEITLARHERDPLSESVFEIVDSGRGKSGPRDFAHAERLLRNQAPGYTPVAYFDSEREEWVK